MPDKDLLAKIDVVDWSSFDGPATYVAARVPEALRALVKLEDPWHAKAVGDAVLNALANNHSGGYYPAVLEAIDIIIEVATRTPNAPRGRCALAVLNDLYYFGPEMGDYTGISEDVLKAFVQGKLGPYADEKFGVRR